jgi:hypothetical protein
MYTGRSVSEYVANTLAHRVYTVLVMIAKTGNQPRFLSTSKCMKKTGQTHNGVLFNHKEE